MWPMDLVTFTAEILNGKLHFHFVQCFTHLWGLTLIHNKFLYVWIFLNGYFIHFLGLEGIRDIYQRPWIFLYCFVTHFLHLILITNKTYMPTPSLQRMFHISPRSQTKHLNNTSSLSIAWSIISLFTRDNSKTVAYKPLIIFYSYFPTFNRDWYTDKWINRL